MDIGQDHPSEFYKVQFLYLKNIASLGNFEILCGSSNHAPATPRAHKDVPLGGSATGPGSRRLPLDSPGQTSSRERRVERHGVCY
jgi:hypothetical protein